MRVLFYVSAAYKDSSVTARVCVPWAVTVYCWGWGQMAPGWVRISQLHMKAERPWDGRLKKGMTDCSANDGGKLASFCGTVEASCG